MPEIGTVVIGLDDTPVDGETTKAITSNWAYDHKADASAHHTKYTNAEALAIVQAYLPWTISIDVFPTPKSNMNWDTLSLWATYVHTYGKSSDGTQNAEITWDLVLAAGTWALELIHQKNVNCGIYSIQFDSVEKGTIDGYAASGEDNVRSSITGIVVPTTSKIELKLKMSTKHASSSAYVGRISGLRLIRTA